MEIMSGLNYFSYYCKNKLSQFENICVHNFRATSADQSLARFDICWLTKTLYVYN